jgi:hypothetical protein
MPSFTIDAPNGKSYTIEGDNAQGALSALRKHLGDEGGKPTEEPADHGLSERQKLSPIEKAVNPITSYPETYQRMNKEARDQISRGAGQIANHESLTDLQAHGISDVLTGAANMGLGAVGYVASPISAAYRSIAGQPDRGRDGHSSRVHGICGAVGDAWHRVAGCRQKPGAELAAPCRGCSNQRNC